MQTITLTSVTSTTPLSKTFTTPDGVIRKEAAANMYAGHGNTVTVSFPEGFKELITTDNTHQALIHGVNQFSDSYTFITASDEKDCVTPDTHARTKANFVYPDVPGLIMFDYDPSPHGIRFDNEKDFLWRLASHLDIPDLLTCAYIARGSVSAGVHLKGEQPKQDSGFHLYIPVQNISDAPRVADVFYKRSILKGLGFAEIAKNGSILLKTIFDKSVFSPERIDFIAAPILKSNDLEYTPPEITERAGSFLDTTKLLDLSKNEEDAYRYAAEKIRNDAKPESKKTENTYLKKYRRKQLKAGVKRQKVKRDIATLRNKKDTLPLSFTVTGQDGSSYTIQQLIDAKQSLDGLVIADPVEGVEYGTSTAKWFFNDGVNSQINSNAHGGIVYSIERPATTAPTHHVTPTQASTQLEEITTDWITSLDKNVAIKASAGTGKTRATIEAINENKVNGQVHVFVPTHKLGGDWTELIEGNVLQRFGRNEENCQRIDKVSQVAAKGVPIYSSMCKQGEDICPFYEQCTYIKQYKTNADVVVMPHSLLKLNHSKLEEKPAAVVIDESFYSELIGNSKKKLIKDIIDFKVLKDDSLHYKIIEAMQRTETPFFDSLRDTTQLSSSEIVEQLTAVMDDINQLSKPHTTHGITPTSSDFDIKLKLSKVHRFINEISLINAIIKELDAFPDRKESRLVKVISADEYVILTRSNNNRLEYYKNNDIPVLLIDADADATILNKLVHAPEFHEIAVKRNATVTQYDNSQFAKSRFFPKGTENPPDLKRVNFAVDMITKVAGNDKTLLVTYKALEEVLVDSLPSNIDTLHFGAVRGVDRFKHHSKVIVIGRNQPPLYAMQNIASSLFWDEEDYTDDRYGLIMHQHRECEVLQAIDRLRFIHNGDSTREIHILNNLSLNIDVDVVKNSNVLKSKKADFLGGIAQELKGILPTSPTLLHKKWGEEKGFTIQQIKDCFKGGKNVYSNYYIQKSPLKKYRLKRAVKGHDLKVHYLPHLSIDEVKAKLEILHGEEIVFKEPQIEKQPIPRYVEIEGGLTGYTIMEDIKIGDCVALMKDGKRDGGGLGCITSFPQPPQPTIKPKQDTILIRFTLIDGSTGLVRGYPDVDSAVIGLRLRYSDRLTDVANVAGYRDG